MSLDKNLSIGKQSLEKIMRDKAYESVRKELALNDINIDMVSDEDLELLVGDKLKEMKNISKGIGIGAIAAGALALIGF